MSLCAHCQKPLTLDVDFSDDDDNGASGAASSSAAAGPQTVPDDVALSCGCHFHCRDISTTAPSGAQQVLCTLHNEGGLQEGLDILPLLTEESYLRAYPEDRICRAFLEFCREGDVAAVVDLLKSCGDNDEEDDEDDDDMDDDDMDDEPGPKKTMDEILRYQDPIGDMQSGLHAAVAGGSREIAWLLLLLASQLPELEFPALVYQEAASLGIMRDDQTGKVDIRTLKDSQGRTAEQLAAEMGGVWHGWSGTGRLAV
ncbi:hypothetical protein MBLNU459_g1758t1 [Dothideomycetes sp. NU459]